MTFHLSRRDHEMDAALRQARRELIHSDGNALDLETFQDFGAQITVDTCILALPTLPDNIRFLTTDTDFFFALASVVADELYASPLPLCALSEVAFDRLRTGGGIRLTAEAGLETKGG
jgi:hypothetical protein